MRRRNSILDRFTFGLGQATESPDIQINPPHRIIAIPLAHQHDLGRHQARITDNEPPRLDHHLRQCITKMLGHRPHDRIAKLVDLRNILAIPGWKAAAQVQHPQIDPGLGKIGEQHRHSADCHLIRTRRGLLAADMERQSVWVQPQLTRLQHQLTGALDGGAELTRQRPVSPLILHQDPAVHPSAGGVGGQLLQLLPRVEGKHRHTGRMRAPNR